jgi:hypothetical protein
VIHSENFNKWNLSPAKEGSSKKEKKKKRAMIEKQKR